MPRELLLCSSFALDVAAWKSDLSGPDHLWAKNDASRAVPSSDVDLDLLLQTCPCTVSVQNCALCTVSVQYCTFSKQLLHFVTMQSAEASTCQYHEGPNVRLFKANVGHAFWQSLFLSPATLVSVTHPSMTAVAAAL